MSNIALFVYGSLCQGMIHYEKISRYVTEAVPGKVQGTAYRLQVGFPVFLDQGSDWVQGSLLHLEASDVLMALLDGFHGFSALQPDVSLFHKKTVPVVLADDQTTTALTYVINPAKLPRAATVIPGGDWRTILLERPALLGQLTERQATYIKKLGGSTGRDIVPIDLDLYRELMKLDLIVDKGRRLALTKLGNEVYRYLSL